MSVGFFDGVKVPEPLKYIAKKMHILETLRLTTRHRHVSKMHDFSNADLICGNTFWLLFGLIIMSRSAETLLVVVLVPLVVLAT
jgi:hypothetical protein